MCAGESRGTEDPTGLMKAKSPISDWTLQNASSFFFQMTDPNPDINITGLNINVSIILIFI